MCKIKKETNSADNIRTNIGIWCNGSIRASKALRCGFKSYGPCGDYPQRLLAVSLVSTESCGKFV